MACAGSVPVRGRPHLKRPNRGRGCRTGSPTTRTRRATHAPGGSWRRPAIGRRYLSGHYDPAENETDALNIDDSRRAWDGLVKLAAHQFGPDDDVVALVSVLGSDGETQDAFGTQWPIGKIVRALNGRSRGDSWNDDRVENAKRRLTKCIARVRQAHGLDAVDLRALLARYSREHHRLVEGARATRQPHA